MEKKDYRGKGVRAFSFCFSSWGSRHREFEDDESVLGD